MKIKFNEEIDINLIEFKIIRNKYDYYDLKCKIGETKYDVICPIFENKTMIFLYDEKYYLYYSDNCQSNVNTSINILNLNPFYNYDDKNSARYNTNSLKFSLILIFCLFL